MPDLLKLLPDVRAILLDETRAIPDERVAMLLSAGNDSLACAFALEESGRTVVCYSFMLDGVLSTDFREAQRRARVFGWEFAPIFLPRDLASLQRDLLALARLGAKKKTDFECGWPVYRALLEIRERAIVTGNGADFYFGLTRRANVEYRGRLDDFRRFQFSRPDSSQKHVLNPAALALGKTIYRPFMAPAMLAGFLGTTWDQCNKPRQKQPILDAFAEKFKRVPVFEHCNLQLGDSRIAEHFNILLKSEWNTMRAKSPVSIYNALARGSIREAA